MKPFVFYISFTFEDESRATYGLTGTSILTEKLIKKATKEWGSQFDANEFSGAGCDFYTYITEAIEAEFGVHDLCCYPDDRVESIGYDTYEVDRQNTKRLMNTWRKVFTDIAGEENVSKVVKLTDISGLNDYEIYELINGKL